MLEWLGPVGGIILLDLVLSGDNALVIGAAASGLARRQRWLAIALGGGGAIVLRILFATAATLLLQLPLLQAIGAVLLIVIAIRLLMEREPKENHQDEENKEDVKPAKKGFFAALTTILVADVSMSLDNVLAVGALAQGHILVLALGILLSIIILLLGSALVSELIGRLPVLLDVASLVLAWTAGHMFLEDKQLGSLLEHLPWADYSIPAIFLLVILVVDIYLRWRVGRKRSVEVKQTAEAQHSAKV